MISGSERTRLLEDRIQELEAIVRIKGLDKKASLLLLYALTRRPFPQCFHVFTVQPVPISLVGSFEIKF